MPLVAHVPPVAPDPLPQVPPMPHAAFEWQLPPGLHMPVWPVPPQVPSPQSLEEWQGRKFAAHVPPPHVPLPHWVLAVHRIGEQVVAPQVPPLHSEFPVQVHAFCTHARPMPQSLSMAQGVCPHVPVAAPWHVNDPFGQSALVPHGSLQRPTAPGLEPTHVAEKPQSASLMHRFVPPTSAFADAWKSL
jgi:hypothetical protein